MPAGTLYAGYAPAGSFTLTVDGHTAARQPAFGWAAQYAVSAKGEATLSLSQFPFVPFVVLAGAGRLGAAGTGADRPAARGAVTPPPSRRRSPSVTESATLIETVTL